MAKSNNKQSRKEGCCSFCGRNRNSVKVLFQGGDGVTICNDCIEMGYNSLVSSEIISVGAKKRATTNQLKAEDILKPQQIKDFLDNLIRSHLGQGLT